MSQDPLHDMRDAEDARQNYMDGYRAVEPPRGPRVNGESLSRWSTSTGKGCWCGETYNHDWPGKADGAPHPREVTP